jgi:hypothetical protein
MTLEDESFSVIFVPNMKNKPTDAASLLEVLEEFSQRQWGNWLNSQLSIPKSGVQIQPAPPTWENGEKKGYRNDPPY